MNIRIVRLSILLAALLFAPLFTQSASVSDGGYITGTVSNSSGRSARSLWVVISQGTVQKGRSLTGDDGRYYVDRLDDGTYDVRVMRGDVQLYNSQVLLPRDKIYNIRVN